MTPAEAAVETLVIAAAIAASPPPVIAMVALLTTPRARANGPAMLAGWLLGLATIGLVALLLLGAIEGSDDSPAWRDGLRVAAGVALLALAARSWSSRPRSGELAKPPGWLAGLDRADATRSFGLGLLLSLANPKTLVLGVAGATIIADADLAAAGQLALYAGFTLVGSLGVGVPLVAYFALGDRAPGVLARLREWLVRHSATIMAGLLAVFGVILAVQGLVALAS